MVITFHQPHVIGSFSFQNTDKDDDMMISGTDSQTIHFQMLPSEIGFIVSL